MTPLVIDGYRLANETLRHPHLRQAMYDGSVLIEHSLLNLHGEEHRARRDVETKVFRRDFFRWYERSVFPQSLRETFAPYLVAGRADLVDFGFHIMLNLTADFAGIDRPLRTRAETEHLVRLLGSFGKSVTFNHALGDKAAIRAEIEAAVDDFDRTFFTPSMQRRRELLARLSRGELAEDDLPRDVLTELLRNEAKVPLTHDALVKEIGVFFLAGGITSIHSLTHAMHELFTWGAAHPEDGQRIRTDPVFLQRCIHESMRLHPSSPVAGRSPVCPMHLPQGTEVSPGDYITLDLQAANRDATVFGADAAVFNPHREVQKGAPPYGLTFGIGVHTCMGMNLAAGALPNGQTVPAEHQLGTVALIAQALLAHHARPDPDQPGVMDTSTSRQFWQKYPILLGPEPGDAAAH